MSQIAHSVTGKGFTDRNDGALESRILLVMAVSVLVGVGLSAVLAPWRFTTGLILGGALSLLNYRWLHSSVAAIFETGADGQAPRARSSRYLLRYFVVGISVVAAYRLQMVSLAATIVGLCAFVPALMFEALRQFYCAIFYREESF